MIAKYPSDRQFYVWHLVYLDRLFLLSNLEWRRAHVRLRHWQGSKCKCKCFAAFSLRTKNFTLICIYGGCNAILLFTSQKKSLLLFCFRDTCTFARISIQKYVMICFRIKLETEWFDFFFQNAGRESIM